MDAFDIQMTDTELKDMTSLELAFLGDAVYSLLVRARICAAGGEKASVLHRLSIEKVSAHAQAGAAERIDPLLTEEERAVMRRGRNAKVNTVPHSASVGEYHSATGLEALFGWLYLKGRRERIKELFEAALEV